MAGEHLKNMNCFAIQRANDLNGIFTCQKLLPCRHSKYIFTQATHKEPLLAKVLLQSSNILFPLLLSLLLLLSLSLLLLFDIYIHVHQAKLRLQIN
jgi:hypothetical protein